MKSRHQPSLLEAIETLETIVDLDETGRELELFLDDLDFKQRRIAWLRDETGEDALGRVRELFSVVLSYLKHFDAEDDSELRLPNARREIVTMMVLVGEAAKKLDRYTNLFHGVHEGAVISLPEFQDLQHFYKRKLDARLEGEQLLEEERMARDELEKVKRDIDYELFSLRRENGQPFVTRELVDRIRLVCNFGDLFLEEYAGEDPLIYVYDWKDRIAQIAAKNIIEGMRPFLDGFYPLATSRRDNRFVARLGDAVLACKMAASPANRVTKGPRKSCLGYFQDFQGLLRQALITEEYHKLIAYPPRGNRFMRSARDLAHAICYHLYTEIRECRDMVGRIHHLVIEGGGGEAETVVNRLVSEYEAISRVLSHHPNGPLLKAFDWIQEGGSRTYDPLIQGNLPERWCDLEVGDETTGVLRLPTPTGQERVHQAWVLEEFRAFVRACRLSPIVQKLLVINLQDRTSWKEHARARALEELQEEEVLTVVSLPTHTEFYHQVGAYRDLDQWPLFHHTYLEQLQSEEGGYFFPDGLRERLFPEFADRLLGGLHRLFFGGSQTLSRRQRQDLIELFHFALTCKLIEDANPDMVAYTCKDGLDISATATCGLLIGLHLLSGHEIHSGEWEWLRTMLYAPVLMVRERSLQRAPFYRMASMLDAIEGVVRATGPEGARRLIGEELGPLYRGDILEARVATPFAADETA